MNPYYHARDRPLAFFISRSNVITIIYLIMKGS